MQQPPCGSAPTCDPQQLALRASPRLPPSWRRAQPPSRPSRARRSRVFSSTCSRAGRAPPPLTSQAAQPASARASNGRDQRLPTSRAHRHQSACKRGGLISHGSSRAGRASPARRLRERLASGGARRGGKSSAAEVSLIKTAALTASPHLRQRNLSPSSIRDTSPAPLRSAPGRARCPPGPYR